MNCLQHPLKQNLSLGWNHHIQHWRFIDEHAERFAPNPRMRSIVTNWLRRGDENKKTVRGSARAFLDAVVPA